MNVLILGASMLLGALTFVGQDVPGLRVGPVRSLTGQGATNFRQCDLDADGAADLLLPGAVVFQRNGSFPAQARQALPDFGESPLVDVWAGALYFRLRGRLAIFHWAGTEWRCDLDQALSWPPQEEVFEGVRATPTHGSAPARLQRFLYDLDGDNTPELVAVNAAGVYLYTRREGLYGGAAPLPVFPALRLSSEPAQALWPAQSRHILFPARQMACRFFLDGEVLRVLTREEGAEGLAAWGAQSVRYVCTAYPLRGAAAWTVRQDAVARVCSEALPAHLQPCRLNGDGVIDYAGGQWEVSETSVLPVPIYATWATLDGGKTFYVQRAPSLQHARPHCSFVDFEGDGDLDMVAEATGLFDGGPRETLERFLTRSAVDHSIRIHVQGNGRFANTPSLTARLTIALAYPPCQQGPMFERYRAAELINVTGDFNGDGYRDLVVRDRADRLSIYLAAGFAYPSEREAVVSIPAPGHFGVADVNADGQSDLVVRWRVGESGEGAELCRVYYAREVLQ